MSPALALGGASKVFWGPPGRLQAGGAALCMLLGSGGAARRSCGAGVLCGAPARCAAAGPRYSPECRPWAVVMLLHGTRSGEALHAPLPVPPRAGPGARGRREEEDAAPAPSITVGAGGYAGPCFAIPVSVCFAREIKRCFWEA